MNEILNKAKAYILSIIISCNGFISVSGNFDEKMVEKFYKDANLELAKSDAETYIEINSPGGYNYALDPMVEATDILEQRKNVICHVSNGNMAASNGALYLMNCNNIELDDNAVIVFHVSRQYNSDNTVKKYVPWDDPINTENWKQFNRIANQQEIERFKNNEDIYYTGAELKKRLGI